MIIVIDQSHSADALRTENKRLLDELEDLYLRIEGQILASEREREIACA